MGNSIGPSSKCNVVPFYMYQVGVILKALVFMWEDNLFDQKITESFIPLSSSRSNWLMSIRPQVLGCFCPLDEALSSAYSLCFSTCQLSVGSWFVWEIALCISGQLGIRSCRLIQPALINKTSDCFAPWNRAQRYQPGIWGGRGKTTTSSFFSFCTRLFKFKFITKFGTKKIWCTTVLG